MANNNEIYNAALAGAIAAAKLGRWITNPVSSSYASDRDTAVAFANTVDAAIPADEEMNQSKAQIILSLVNAVLAYKCFGVAQVTTELAAAVAALYNELTPVLLPVSGGGSSLADGTYIGQPLYWDGSVWGPLPIDGILRPNIMGLSPLPSENIEFRIELVPNDGQTETYLTLVAQGALGRVTLYGESEVQLFGGFCAMRSEAVEGVAKIECRSGEGFAVKDLADAINISFFNGTPAPMQTVVGVTTQDQVNSIVSALQTYNLIIDGR